MRIKKLYSFVCILLCAVLLTACNRSGPGHKETDSDTKHYSDYDTVTEREPDTSTEQPTETESDKTKRHT